MNLGMEFHDSRIIELAVSGERGHILFHGVVFRSEGVLGVEGQEAV
jgi:hypothetical protein